MLEFLGFFWLKDRIGENPGESAEHVAAFGIRHSAIRAITGEQVKNANQYFGPASYPFDPTRTIERGRSESSSIFVTIQVIVAQWAPP